MVLVPVVSQALYCPKPAGTCRLIAAGLAALPPLCPGLSAITVPDSAGAGAAWVTGADEAGGGGVERGLVDKAAVLRGRVDEAAVVATALLDEGPADADAMLDPAACGFGAAVQPATPPRAAASVTATIRAWRERIPTDCQRCALP